LATPQFDAIPCRTDVRSATCPNGSRPAICPRAPFLPPPGRTQRR